MADNYYSRKIMRGQSSTLANNRLFATGSLERRHSAGSAIVLEELLENGGSNVQQKQSDCREDEHDM